MLALITGNLLLGFALAVFGRVMPRKTIFGVEKKWAERFKDINFKPPSSSSSSGFSSGGGFGGGGGGSW